MTSSKKGIHMRGGKFDGVVGGGGWGGGGVVVAGKDRTS